MFSFLYSKKELQTGTSFVCSKILTTFVFFQLKYKNISQFFFHFKYYSFGEFKLQAKLQNPRATSSGILNYSGRTDKQTFRLIQLGANLKRISELKWIELNTFSSETFHDPMHAPIPVIIFIITMLCSWNHHKIKFIIFMKVLIPCMYSIKIMIPTRIGTSCYQPQTTYIFAQTIRSSCHPKYSSSASPLPAERNI